MDLKHFSSNFQIFKKKIVQIFSHKKQKKITKAKSMIKKINLEKVLVCRDQ